MLCNSLSAVQCRRCPNTLSNLRRFTFFNFIPEFEQTKDFYQLFTYIWEQLLWIYFPTTSLRPTKTRCFGMPSPGCLMIRSVCSFLLELTVFQLLALFRMSTTGEQSSQVPLDPAAALYIHRGLLLLGQAEDNSELHSFIDLVTQTYLFFSWQFEA